MGDVLTLTGANFQPPGGPCDVTVHFGSLAVPVASPGDTSLSVAVPAGAISGPVTVSTTATVNGQPVTQTSNPADILVIWKDFDPYPYGLRLGWNDALLPGDADDLYAVTVTYVGQWGMRAVAYRITDQGQASRAGSLYWPQRTDYWRRAQFYAQASARNPANGQIYTMLVETDNKTPPFMAYEIRSVNAGNLLLATQADYTYGGCPNGAWGTSAYRIVAFGFDAQGNLLVVAEIPECTHLADDGAGGWLTVIDRSAAYNFWWYPVASLNGSTVVLSPGTALLPAAVPMGDFRGGVYAFINFGLAVAPSGDAVCRVYWTADFVDGVPQQVEQIAWAIPPVGSQEPVQQLPVLPAIIPVDRYSTPFNAFGTVAADCMGRFYAMGVNPSGGGPGGPVVEYERGLGGGWTENMFTAAGGQGGAGCAVTPFPFADHLAADAYGNLYEAGGGNPWGLHTLHRVLPCELVNPNYYDDFTCCPANVPLAGLVHKARGEQLQIECSTGTLKLKLTPEPGDPISGDPGDLNAFAWITPDADGRADASVLFGQAPNLEAVWQDHPGGAETGETVKWEVSQELAPSADPKGLYPSKPELLFTGGASPYTNSALQFQTVHLGTFVLKATTANRDHKGANGQPAFIEVTVTVAHPDALNDLGEAHHEYDGMIIYYADKYGIPPQYIKSQALNESGLNANAFRYELRTIDRGLLSQRSSGYWADPVWNLNYYQMPASQPSSHLFPEDIQPRHIYDVTDFRDAVPPAWPYTCHELLTPSPYDPVTLFHIYEANDGWPCLTVPWQVYNPQAKNSQGTWECDLELRTGPCRRLGWYDADRAFNTGLSTTVTYLRHTNTFYCGWISSRPCAPTETESQWLMNNGSYIAQTPVASSYGLMQVLYITAVQGREWKSGINRGDERHPSFLLNPSTSLDLGAGFDAKQMICVTGGASLDFSDRTTYQKALTTGFGAYNGSCKTPVKAYGQAIVSNAGQMMPY